MKKFACRCLRMSLLMVAALNPLVYAAADPALEKHIDELLANMSLTEKIGQTQLRDWGTYAEKDMPAIKQAVRDGKIGGFLNVTMSSDKQIFS